MTEQVDQQMRNADEAAELLPSRAERIEALNNIDHDIAKLLHLAGQAMRTLGQVPAHGNDQEQPSLEERKKVFQESISDYTSLLSKVDVNLRRQIWALEEAKILPSGSPILVADPNEARSALPEKKPKDSDGLGNLDVGWLNSRNDKVGKEMEAELWTQARELLEDMRSDGRNGGNLDIGMGE